MSRDRKLIILTACLGVLAWGIYFSVTAIKKHRMKHGVETRRAKIHDRTHTPGFWEESSYQECDQCLLPKYDLINDSFSLEWQDCNCETKWDRRWIKDRYHVTKKWKNRDNQWESKEFKVTEEEFDIFIKGYHTTIEVKY